MVNLTFDIGCFLSLTDFDFSYGIYCEAINFYFTEIKVFYGRIPRKNLRIQVSIYS